MKIEVLLKGRFSIEEIKYIGKTTHEDLKINRNKETVFFENFPFDEKYEYSFGIHEFHKKYVHDYNVLIKISKKPIRNK